MTELEPSAETPVGVLAPFIGREREIELLGSGLDKTLSVHGQLFLIEGEPGIGKTRLADRVAELAVARGMRVIWGRCWEGGGAPAYWPWVQIFRFLDSTLTGALEPSSHPSDLTAIARTPEDSDRIPPAESQLSIGFSAIGRDHNQERFQLFDSLNSRLQEASAATPLLLILDDCHAADAASMLLLKFVARDLRRARIMLVATYRAAEVQLSSFLPGLLAEIARDGRTLALSGMVETEVNRFVSASSGKKPDVAFVRALHQITEGNPLFLGELVQLLLAEGRAAQIDTPGLTKFKIPSGIRSVILRRLDLVSPDTRAVLSTAAAIGREFDLYLLKRVCGHSTTYLETALAEASRYALVREVEESVDRFRFMHALIAETLYADLTRLGRQELHQRIANAIEDLFPSELGPHLSKLAHHHTHSLPLGNPDKAFHYAARAAAQAERTLAYEEAVRFYELALNALDVLSGQDRGRRCEITLALGEALYSSGRFAESRDTFERAAAEAAMVGDAQKHAAAVLGFGLSPSTPGVSDRTLISMLEDALSKLGELDSPLRAAIMARLAEELYWSDESARRTALSLKAVEIARRTGNKRALVDVLYSRHIVLTEPDTTGERLAISDEIIQLTQNLEARNAILRAHYLRIEDLLEVGEIEAADREIEIYVQRTHELHQQRLGISDLILAMRALMTGRFEEGERLALRAFEAAHHRREGFATQILAAQISVVRREQGRLGELTEIIKGFTVQYPNLTFARCGLAFCYSQIGDEAAAALEFRNLAVNRFDSIPRNATWLPSLVLLSEVCAYLGDRDAAALLYQLLKPYAARNAALDVYVSYGSVAHYLGILAFTIGNLNEAATHFEAALEFNLKMGAKPWGVHTRYKYAATLLARGAEGDYEKALELGGLALSTADSLGMKAVGNNLRELVGPDLRGATGPDGTVSILFSDIEDSSGMTEKLGDLRAQELLRAHNAIIREQIKSFKGFEVKSMGDGFMIAFSSARSALLCAIAIQRAFVAYRRQHPDAPIRVSIGIHAGEAIKEGGDFYGMTVIIAARIGGEATANEILVSSAIKEITESSGDLSFGSAHEIQLKGLGGTHRLYSVEWEN